jgi:hypothetical protein
MERTWSVASTARDWLERARTAADPTEKTRCLEQAEAAVRRPSELIEIAQAHLGGTDGHSAARRLLERALELATDDVWVYRRAAQCFARGLADPGAARRALDTGRAYYRGHARARIGSVRLLAAGFLEQGDRATARACLEDARPRDVRDLCELAGAHHELGELDEARARLHDASRRARSETDPREIGCWWPIANAWRSLFANHAAADAALDEGLVRATTTAGCVTMARAWASQEITSSEASMARCLARGKELARSTDDWLEIGLAYFEVVHDANGAASCLEAALARAPASSELRKIAHGFRHWVGDGARADQIAPRGVRPAGLLSPRRPTPGFTPDANALFDWLRAQLTDAQLRAIAASDYGSHLEENLAILSDVRDSGLVPERLDWCPIEVLELTRWREGEGTDHVTRAFACTLLTIDAIARGGRDGFESTLAALVESCIVLGKPALERSIGLLSAEMAAHDDEETASFSLLHYGLLLALTSLDSADARLPALAERLLEREPDWLEKRAFGLRRDLWQALGAELLPRAAEHHPALQQLAHVVRATATD